MTEIVITSSILIVVVLILRTVFWGRISSTARYALWLIVALRLVLPFALAPSPVSVMNWTMPKTAHNARAATGEPAKGEMTGTDVMLPDTMSPKNPEIKDPMDLTGGIKKESPQKENQENSSNQRPPILQEPEKSGKSPTDLSVSVRRVWLLGMTALLLWFAGVNVLFCRKLRCRREKLDFPCPLDVYVTDGIASPCIFGFFRPCVYVTREAASERELLDFVVLHEYCHYRHGDMFWTVLRQALVAVYWFSPLVWLAALLAKRDCECACDEAVIRRMGEERRLEYGRALVAMIQNGRGVRFGVASTMMSSGGRALKVRIDCIARKPKNTLSALICSAVVLFLAAGCTFTSAATSRDEEGAGEPGRAENNVISETENQTVSDMNYHPGDVIYSMEKELHVRQNTNVVSRKFRVDFVMTKEDYPGGRVMADKNMLWGSFAFRVYDEDGNLKSEQTVAGDDMEPIRIDAAKDAISQCFAPNQKWDKLIVFRDRCVYEGETSQYSSLFYGLTAEGEIFPYHIERGGVPEGMFLGEERLLTGDFSYVAAEQMLGLGEQEMGGADWYINYCSAKPPENRDALCVLFFDEQTRTVRSIHAVSGERSDAVLAAAKKAMFVEYKMLSLSLNVPLRTGEILERVNGSDNVGYCEVDRNIAIEKEELVEYIEDAFAGYPIARFSSRAELEDELFSKDARTFVKKDGSFLPYFKMIDGKLCYLHEYRGVAGNPTDCIVTQKMDDETYRVFFVMHYPANVGIDSYVVKKCADGVWRVQGGKNE